MQIHHAHTCGRTHRTVQSLVTCMYHDDHPMVLGDGAVAVLERCEMLVITLFPTIAQAERRLRRLDELGCGGRCEGLHDIVVLLPERDGEPAEAVSPRGRDLG